MQRKREIGGFAAAMIDRRLIDGAQDAVRNIGGSGNLEKVSAGLVCHRNSHQKIAYQEPRDELRRSRLDRPPGGGTKCPARPGHHRAPWISPPEAGVARRSPAKYQSASGDTRTIPPYRNSRHPVRLLRRSGSAREAPRWRAAFPLLSGDSVHATELVLRRAAAGGRVSPQIARIICRRRRRFAPYAEGRRAKARAHLL